MASPTQTIMFTAMPRAVVLDSPTLPISVLVSPRLAGAATLSSFPDWLLWTERLKTNGLKITVSAGASTVTVPIDTAPLQPKLWAAIFDPSTRVDDYVFDDYTQRLVLSYPNRLTLTLLKSIFQIGGLQLALPTKERGDEPGNRRALRQLIDGLAVNWNEDRALRWREALRRQQRVELERLQSDVSPGALNPFRSIPTTAAPFTADEPGGDFLPNATQLPPPDSPRAQQLRRDVAVQFALYHHQPQAPSFVPPDMDKVVDFHKAITALQSYPPLLRALGLVFDLDLPSEALPFPPAGSFGTLAVSKVEPGWSWAITPTPVPPGQTAYDLLKTPDGHVVFLPAPRSGLAPPDPSGQVIGLLNLDPRDFGLAQVDIDGAMHKAIILAESFDNTAPPLHPEVFDPTATLPALRSAGLALVSDANALALLQAFDDAKAFNDALGGGKPQPRPFFAEDLVRGFRLDVWDSHTQAWHSLHRRDAVYTLKDQTFTSKDEEGSTHFAVSGGAPGSDPAQIGDFYLQEAIARWNGWSLSVPPIGKHLTRNPDPAKAVPPDDPANPDFDPENPPSTPFKMTTAFTVVNASLPTLRFGRLYRMRARAVDVAGNSLPLDGVVTDGLSTLFATPPDPRGFAYLRYEPVAAPFVVLRDPAGVSSSGSAIDRLVIRTFNDAPSKDGAAADLGGSERHILPPRIAVEMGERLGMFDDTAGKLRGDAATYALIRERDEGKVSAQAVPGQTEPMPLIGDPQAIVPYLPDLLARGAVLRDLPGARPGSTARADASTSADPVVYPAPHDANPQPTSALVVDFAAVGDWTKSKPFRIALADGAGPPGWDAAARLLTLRLPKATMFITPLSSFLAPEDLPLMGVWQWMREYFDALVRTLPIPEDIFPGSAADVFAHIVQRAQEGGHWMLTPPHLLTLVHAVQQPIGHPSFLQLDVQHIEGVLSSALQSEDMSGPTRAVALSTLTGWRTPNSLDAFLIGGLRVHAASTAKVDITAEWTDPVDDSVGPLGTIHQKTHAEEIPLTTLDEDFLTVTTGASDTRAVAFYIPTHDLICFVRAGDVLSATLNGVRIFQDAAPRHHLNDTKHHKVSYTAVATSRFQDYFTPTLDPADPASPARIFTRQSAPVAVDIPASARPAAPQVRYVVPTFGWERQTGTNLKRSVRFGGGLRVYMNRPWYSSGAGEQLGVVLYGEPSSIDREAWKSFVTQWGLDPIWDSDMLPAVPDASSFPRSVATEAGLSLEEPTPAGASGPGRVDVAGHEPHFDGQHWFCDVVVESFGDTYTPFIRLALARYQPHALDDAKLSRVVLADFAQYLPDRSLLVTADPYHPGRVRVTVSGPVPRGPVPTYPDFPPIPNAPGKPTQVVVTVQERDPAIPGDLGWREASAGTATVTTETDSTFPEEPYLALWSGTVQFDTPTPNGQFRLLIREFEFVSADWAIIHPGGEARPPFSEAPGRLIYAETVLLDAALTGVAA